MAIITNCSLLNFAAEPLAMKQFYFLLIGIITTLILHAQPVIEWRGSFGGRDYETPAAVQPTNDGGLIMVGTTYSTDDDAINNKGVSDILVIKLRANKSVEWKKTLGGTNEDGAHDVQLTSDGGYIIAGYTKSNDGDVTQVKGASDYWIIKLRANGTVQWQRTYGGSQMDVASSIKELPGGRYIATGYAMSNDGDVTNNHFAFVQDVWVVRLDNQGNIVWQRCYGGTDSDFAYKIELTATGYIFCGYSRSANGDLQQNKGGQDVWVVKLDNNGTIEWQTTLGGSLNENAFDMKEVPAGGYIVAATTSSADVDVTGNHGTTDMWVIRLDADGKVIWNRCLGGTSLEAARSVNVAGNGQFIVAGSAESTDNDVQQLHGRSDYWIVGLSSSGAIEWQKNLGGTGIDDAMTSYLANGKLLVAGTSFSNDDDVTTTKDGGDIWVVELKFNTPLPVIVTQPKNADACNGSNASFKIEANNATSYQWQGLTSNGWTNLINDNTYSGVQTNILAVSNVGSSTLTSYRCIVANQHGQVISGIVTLQLLSPPVIAQQPANSSACIGSDADIAVRAQGSATYQWQQSTNGLNWQHITSASASTLTTKVFAGTSFYRCVISNQCFSVTSAVAQVTGRDCAIPNAFTPNGDGINDKWVIPFLNDYNDVLVVVYDRYGQKMIESKGKYQPWDGKVSGKAVPIGVYYYTITLPGSNKPFSGPVTILK